MKLLVFLLFPILTFSQNSQKQIEIDKVIFESLYKIRCDGFSNLHDLINRTQIFHMIKDEENYVTTYKINSNYDYNFFVSIFNVEKGGFRVNSPNSFLYDVIISKGSFVEVHKENDTSFLVYKFGDDQFLLNSSVDSKGRKHYIIDFWCIK